MKLVDDPTASTLEAGRGIGSRPPSDVVAMERARARAERALFGQAEPARIGRYEIREPIASGGMGVVFAAYDPQLDRRVALKVVHPQRAPDDQSRRRLITEARALAKLDHPNVVKVHDTLEFDEQLVIVMELVDGTTLEDWTHGQPRSWRETVDAYLQAGDGLAAAHAVDVVHRDFKPSNAIVGGDRRVRVLDFGLARFVGDHDETGEDHRSSSAPSSRAPMTLTGTVMGTFAYASPEQLAGGRATQASDQFSFCVSLHRALEGVAPFAGTTINELLISIQAEAVVTNPQATSIPQWLRTAIRRGLSADAVTRHDSMTELLAELRRPRGWQRWKVPATSAALIVVAAVAVAGWAVTRRDEATCNGGETRAATVWTRAQRDLIEQRWSADPGSYAAGVRDRVLSTLDQRFSDWSRQYRTSCETHRHGERSDTLLDRSMACLDRGLRDLSAAVNVLGEIPVDGISAAIDVTAGLHDVGECNDPERLLAQSVIPPLDRRADIDSVRDRVSHGKALLRAGRLVESTTELEAAVEAAEQTGFAPARVEANLAYGRALVEQGDFVKAQDPLTSAISYGIGNGMDAAVVEAAARRIYARSMSGMPLNEAIADVEFPRILSGKIPPGEPATPLLLHNIGAAHLAVGEPDEARRWFKQAEAAVAGAPTSDIELVCIDQSLALVTRDPRKREELMRRALANLSEALGKQHPKVLEAQLYVAQSTSDRERALGTLADACEGYETSHPELTMHRIACWSSVAFLAWLDGKNGLAVTSIERSLAVPAPDVGAIRTRLQLVVALQALLQGRPDQVVAGLETLVSQSGEPGPTWDRETVAQANLLSGLANLALGRNTSAKTELTEALSSYEHLSRLGPDVALVLARTKARSALAGL